jgi:hypothetical protein
MEPGLNKYNLQSLVDKPKINTNLLLWNCPENLNQT